MSEYNEKELAKALETIRNLDKETSQYKEDNKETLQQLNEEIEKLRITDDKLCQQVEKINKERAKIQSEIDQRQQQIDNIYDLIGQNFREKTSIMWEYNYPAMVLTIKSFDDLPLISNMHGVVFDLKEHKEVIKKEYTTLRITDEGIDEYPASYSRHYVGETAFLDISKNEDGSIWLKSDAALNIHSPNVKDVYDKTDELFWKKIQASEAFVEATTGKKLPERQKNAQKHSKTANTGFSKLFNKYFGR